MHTYIRQQRNTATNTSLATITQFQVSNKTAVQIALRAKCRKANALRQQSDRDRGRGRGAEGKEGQTKCERNRQGHYRGKDDERKCEDFDNSWPQATEVLNRQATTKRIKEEASVQRSTNRYLVGARNLHKKKVPGNQVVSGKHSVYS